MLVLAIGSAPAVRRRATENASAAALKLSSVSEPAVVAIRSPVWKLSFTSSGTQCSGPTGPPRA